MFWPGGFLALELTTSTPDALCPPLEEVRAAVKARVGDVRGTYRAEFALVRGHDGRQVLNLLVSDPTRQVLHRELPLDGAGCQDAAQAIALVLERYFDGIEMPDRPPPDPPSRQPTLRPGIQPTPTAPPAPPSPEVVPPVSRWEARLGLLYDVELGVAPWVGVTLFPLAFRFSQSLRLGLALDVAPFLATQTERIHEQEVTAFSVQGALSLPLQLRSGEWRTAVGPWTHLRLQRGEAGSLSNEEPAYRALAGIGGLLHVGWSPWQSWTLGLGVAAGGQLKAAAARFVLRNSDGGSRPVLIPKTWFGQGQLSLALQL